MCGVFGYIGANIRAADLVFEGIKSLEYRGYDSWGVAVISDSPSSSETNQKIFIKKAVGKIGQSHVSSLPDGQIALGHTRWATHGGVTKQNSHPHLSSSDEVAVVHNGIFENFEEHKHSLEEQGQAFESETDTEVIAQLLGLELKKHNLAKALKNVFSLIKGNNAVIAVSVKESVMVAIRDGSPLVIGFGEHENFLASDPAALLPYTNKVSFLKDRELAVLSRDGVKVVNMDSGDRVKPDIQTLTWQQDQAQKGDFDHFMIKEIFDQGAMLETIAHSAGHHHSLFAKSIKKASGLYLVGSGSASHAAMIGHYLLNSVANHSSQWVVASEFSSFSKQLGRDSLVIGLSQSGETMDLLEPLKKVHAQGAKILAIVNVLGSSLYRLAEQQLMIEAGLERAVASTKAFTGKIAHLLLLSFVIKGQLDEARQGLSQSAQSVRKILSSDNLDQIKKIAKKLSGAQSIYVLGRGLNYPVSLEAALKIKEISYTHAEGMALGELKHGTLALIESGTPCIVFLRDGKDFEASLSGVREIKARGGMVIAIAARNHQLYDHFLSADGEGEFALIPSVVVAQLLAYYLSVEKGLDPDMPRNLAKSVTVK